MRCRICGSKLLHYETVHGVPVDNSWFRTSPFESEKKNMELFQCARCGHIQAESILPDNYYNGDYNVFAGGGQYAPSLDFTRKKLEKLRSYAQTGSLLLDIGCGTGNALSAAAGLFESCIGVEPADNTYQIAQERGFHVIHGYFSAELDIKKQTSAFTAFQVFEHLSDIYQVLDYAFELLEPGGVGLINIPNGQEIINHSLYYEVVLEHINYFSAYSASIMANHAGFDVLEIETIPQTIEMDLYIRKPLRNYTFQEKECLERKQLSKILSAYQTVAIWGAGAKSARYVSLLEDPSIVKIVIDSDAKKAGMFLSGLNCPVKIASASLLKSCPCVMIFASSYNSEIIKKLRNDFGFLGDIIYHENNSEWKLMA